MVRLLCIETSTVACSVCVCADGIPLAARHVEGAFTHSENTAQFVSEDLDEAGLRFSDLHGVAVSIGPGSYTGLRIGLALAKGVCFAADLPLIPISSLLVLAKTAHQQLSSDASICAAFDARRMEVWWASYSSDLIPLRPPTAFVIGMDAPPTTEAPNLVVGSGAQKIMEAGLFPTAQFLPHLLPSATALAPLAHEAYKAGQMKDAAMVEPFYLKPFFTTAKGATMEH